MAQNKDVKKMIAKLPDAPGVYLFLGRRSHGGGGERKILYIGKATSLKDRVRSYFNQDIVNTRSPLISKMLSQFDDIKFIKTDSVLEALVLEANLIKKYQPEANIKEKDDRSFNYVVITDEDFPRVLTIRGRELGQIMATETNSSAGSADFSSKNMASESVSVAGKKEKIRIFKTFGPFPNGSQLKEAIKIVRKMFPFRDKCIPFLPPSPSNLPAMLRKAMRAGGEGSGVRSRIKGCFNYQIGLCPGVCTGEINEKEYAKTIKNIVLFFESDKKKLVKNLQKQMKDFAKAREFEKAQKIKKTLFTLNHIRDVSLIKDEISNLKIGDEFRIESYDIAHLSGTNMVGVMTVLEGGEIKKSDYRKFHIKGQSGADDIRALSEVLTRRLSHLEWPMPNLIVVDGGLAQKQAMEKVLKAHNMQIAVVAVVKDERHKPREVLGLSRDLSGIALATSEALAKWEKEILLANAEAHRFALGFHKQLRRAIP